MLPPSSQKGTQRRADITRALRQELQPLVEQHGPAILSQPQLERASAASKHERRGASQAASAAAGTGRGSTPKRGPPSPPRTQRLTLRSRPRTPPTTSRSGSGAAPKRVRPATRSPAPPPYPPTAEELVARGLTSPKIQGESTPEEYYDALDKENIHREPTHREPDGLGRRSRQMNNLQRKNVGKRLKVVQRNRARKHHHRCSALCGPC